MERFTLNVHPMDIAATNNMEQLRGLKPYETSKTNRPTLCYARVSSHDQKDDLLRQVQLLESFCTANGWTYEVMQNLGSGLNYNKKGLQQLIRRICSGSVGRLALTNKDRLLRFGPELIFSLCETFNTEGVLINQGEQPLKFEEELAQDVLEIITVFSARLYESRSHKIGSFRLTGSIRVYEKSIQLPRLGLLRLKERGYLPENDVHILSATVSEKAGRWFVSLQIEIEIPAPVIVDAKPTAGVDLGINCMAQASDGTCFENPRALKKHLTKLKRIQRVVSRRKKGSANRKKAVRQ